MDWDNLTCSLNNRNIDANERSLAETNGSSSKMLFFVPLSTVAPREFLCEYETHCFALCMCCDFFACDCRMKCSEGCSCFHDQTWSANIIECGRRDHAAVPKFIPMDATSIYLDGNRLNDLSGDTFIGRKHLTSLFLNGSRIESISNKTLSGLDGLVTLYLNNNQLTRLGGGEFSDLASLRELHLDHNHLEVISEVAFARLHHLQVLTLDHNRLRSFPVWNLAAVKSLSLSVNPWTCDCGYLRELQAFLRQRGARIQDGARVTCVLGEDDSEESAVGNASCADVLAVSFHDRQNNHLAAGVLSGADSQGMNVPGNDESSRFWDGVVPVIAVVVSALIVVVSLIALAIALRKPIKAW